MGIRVVLLSLFIASCSGIHEGKVIEKRYEEPRHYTYITFLHIGKSTIPQIHNGYDNEDFVITIEGKNKDGEIETNEFYLTKEQWQCIQKGEWFNDSIPCSNSDENNKDLGLKP